MANSPRLNSAAMIASLAEEENVPPEAMEPKVYDPKWSPSLNPTQRLMYEDQTKFILAYGERGSGKSVGGVHKLVKHCWENFNALAIIIVGVKRQATEGGVWHKLENDILPEWQHGVGMVTTESKTNIAKDVFIFVTNRFGGWSKILLLSMPVDSFIRDRAKGLEPSFILIDEAQTLESDAYFNVLIQQLGRRPNISTVQQYVATCNPEGESHWLYKRFFIMPRDEDGHWNPMYKTYHIPIVENEKNLPDGYYETVVEAVRDDPIEYKRMVLGQWIDRPTGDSIFAGYFSEQLHIRGNKIERTRILPNPKHEIILGYDLGSANSAIVFLQNIPTKDKDLWTVFDEMVYTDAYIPYITLIPALVARIDFWNNEMQTKFRTMHISDSSAFNMFRATHGTYDSLEVERLSIEAAKAFPEVDPIRLIECPKFPGSVSGRVKTTMKLLQQERLMISASCNKIREMFCNLESEKLDPRKKDSADLPFHPRRSKHIHAFDAMSYALFYYELGNRSFNASKKPEAFFMGQN